MTHSIKSTSNGPIVIANGELIALSDDQALIAACEEDETLLEGLWTHIESELQNALSTYLDGVSANLNPTPVKVFSYVTACQQYWMFKNHRWASYVVARDNALE